MARCKSKHGFKRFIRAYNMLDLNARKLKYQDQTS